MSNFVHLHLHTQYSLLDGVNKIGQVVKQAAQMNQQAIAITDHGNMHGAIEFYDYAKENKIKPIIGCEVYITPTSRHEKKTKQQGGSHTNHLTILAKNNVGYKNLCKLVSYAYKEGFYFKPRIDHELLEQYHEGLIILSGCLNGELATYILEEREKELKNTIDFYAKLFKDDYYLEVQPHQIFEQQKLNEVLTDYAVQKGIKLVATTDCHYPSTDYHYAQEVLMCISTGKQISDPDHLKHEGVALHLKSDYEMLLEFGEYKFKDQAVLNTLEIADKCKLDFNFNTYYMPKYSDDEKVDLNKLLQVDSRRGLQERIEVFISQGVWDKTNQEIYASRLEEELEILTKMGFAGYFLVVADFINWAKSQGIPVGPGRGSAAGSLVAFALKITEIDPIVHKLLFERFLNPDRISMPDIDVDFCINGRDKVIQYVVEKYGKEKVAQIATFGTLKAKAAIKDVGRVLGLSFAETDRIAQLIPPPRQGFDYSLSDSIKMEPKLKEYAENEGKNLIDLALKLEGLNRHSSTHAAGVVIGDRPLNDMLPMMVDKDGKDVTQYAMKYVEKIGLVKFDFLGLKTLTVIDTAIKLIESSRNIKLDPNLFPLDDAKTFNLLCAGHTVGVFQLESTGITDMTMRLKPSKFDDLVATIALYRPGPLDAGMVDHYINRKHGTEVVQYMHPLMEETLKDTYGIIVYQEQIMQLAQNLAGYSLGEADILRRAMGKKNPSEMEKQRERFVSGAIKNKIDQRLATEIFDQMETFARYGFNRSHSAAYAMISYQTAYLRAHYPVEFMASLMSHEMDDSDKVLKNISECKKHNIPILPPDVNESFANFSATNNCIRFGLSAVKGVGEKAVHSIVSERQENGSFLGLEDLVSRVDLHSVNRRVLENLIKCGGFDFTKISRRELFERLDDVIKAGQNLHRSQNTNQISLFGDQEINKIAIKTSNRPEWPINQKLFFEREAIGLYLSGHPIEKYASALKSIGTQNILYVKSNPSKYGVTIAGVVTSLKLKNTKKGNRYASFILEDMTGTIEAIVWPEIYIQAAQVLHSNSPILVIGKVDSNDERSTLIVDKMETLTDVRDKRAKQAIIRLNVEDDLEEKKDQLLNVLSRHQGQIPLKFIIKNDSEEIVVNLKDKNNKPVLINASELICDQVEEIFGRPILNFI